MPNVKVFLNTLVLWMYNSDKVRYYIIDIQFVFYLLSLNLIISRHNMSYCMQFSGITLCRYVLYIGSMTYIYVPVLSLSFCPISLLFSSFTWLVFSRNVPPHESVLLKVSSLLKGSFSLLLIALKVFFPRGEILTYHCFFTYDLIFQIVSNICWVSVKRLLTICIAIDAIEIKLNWISYCIWSYCVVITYYILLYWW